MTDQKKIEEIRAEVERHDNSDASPGYGIANIRFLLSQIDSLTAELGNMESKTAKRCARIALDLAIEITSQPERVLSEKDRAARGAYCTVEGFILKAFKIQP